MEGVPQLVVMGVAGVGKTTVARALAADLGRLVADADDLHGPANLSKMSAGIPLEETDRRDWLAAVRDQLARWSADGARGVIACSALRRAHRDVLREGGRVVFGHLAADEKVVHDRMERRTDHVMPAALLPSQYAALERLEPHEPGITVPAHLSVPEILTHIVAGLGLEEPSGAAHGGSPDA